MYNTKLFENLKEAKSEMLMASSSCLAIISDKLQIKENKRKTRVT